ncbi:MAG: 50S ribosomal protein L9 [Planctomycetes bacterium]|nr:50S ribosomal protein L9 [Planctomycetota bacterium]
MQLVLRKNIDNLGKIGDIVNVKPGYARNYLLPQDLAMPVSAQNLAQIEGEKKIEMEREIETRKKAVQAAERLAEVSVTIAAKASEEGHLYGSVTAQMVADAFAKDGIEVTPKMVALKEPIKELGVYEVKISISEEIEPVCRVWVVSE